MSLSLTPFVSNKYGAASMQCVIVSFTISVQVPPEDSSFLWYEKRKTNHFEYPKKKKCGLNYGQ